MKKLFISLFVIFSLLSFAQVKVPADLTFTTPFYEAENKYIVFTPKAEEKDLMLGVPYFDEAAGYSYKFLGSLNFDNGKAEFTPAENDFIARWQNLDLKVAVLPEARIKELTFPSYPEFLKAYQTDKLDKDYLLDKLSFQNGSGYSNLALPKLEELRKEGYKSAKFYFELAFAYNALDQFSKAEDAVNEAEKNNFHDELMMKEMHYALLHQNKLSPAADYLQTNFKNFQSQLYKSEGIVNQIINFFNNKDVKNTEKWIKIYKSEIGKDQYKSRVDDIETKLKAGK